jgi:hypothetical protein
MAGVSAWREGRRRAGGEHVWSGRQMGKTSRGEQCAGPLFLSSRPKLSYFGCAIEDAVYQTCDT